MAFLLLDEEHASFHLESDDHLGAKHRTNPRMYRL
jgi:hypothetical protein